MKPIPSDLQLRMRELGRRGGKKKVPKGFARMKRKRRIELGKEGAAKRWGKGPKSR